MIDFNSDDLGAVFRKLHKFPLKTRFLMGVGIFAALSVLSASLYWYPGIDRVISLDEKIQTTLKSLQVKSTVLMKRPQIELELAQLEALVPRLQGALPAEKELPALLGQINDTILKNALALGEFVPGVARDSEVMTLIPVRVKVQGDAEKVAQLPNLIASLPRRVSLNKFDLIYLPEKRLWSLDGEITAFAQLGARINQTTIELGKASTSGGQP